MSRLTADTTQIKAVAGSALSQALRNLIMLVGALVMMFVTSPTLSLLVLVAIPLIVLPLVGLRPRRCAACRARAQDTLAEASAYAAENLGACAPCRPSATRATVSRPLRRARSSARSRRRAQRMQARAGLTALAMFLVVASIVGVLWFGARLP